MGLISKNYQLSDLINDSLTEITNFFEYESGKLPKNLVSKITSIQDPKLINNIPTLIKGVPLELFETENYKLQNSIINILTHANHFTLNNIGLKINKYSNTHPEMVYFLEKTLKHFPQSGKEIFEIIEYKYDQNIPNNLVNCLENILAKKINSKYTRDYFSKINEFKNYADNDTFSKLDELLKQTQTYPQFRKEADILLQQYKEINNQKNKESISKPLNIITSLESVKTENLQIYNPEFESYFKNKTLNIKKDNLGNLELTINNKSEKLFDNSIHIFYEDTQPNNLIVYFNASKKLENNILNRHNSIINNFYFFNIKCLNQNELSKIPYATLIEYDKNITNYHLLKLPLLNTIHFKKKDGILSLFNQKNWIYTIKNYGITPSKELKTENELILILNNNEVYLPKNISIK